MGWTLKQQASCKLFDDVVKQFMGEPFQQGQLTDSNISLYQAVALLTFDTSDDGGKTFKPYQLENANYGTFLECLHIQHCLSLYG